MPDRVLHRAHFLLEEFCHARRDDSYEPAWRGAFQSTAEALFKKHEAYFVHRGVHRRIEFVLRHRRPDLHARVHSHYAKRHREQHHDRRAHRGAHPHQLYSDVHNVPDAVDGRH